MAEHRISRAAVVAVAGVCAPGVSAFDAAVQRQGHGGQDLVYPNGWTRADRDRVRKTYPEFFAWLLHHGFIPKEPIDG